MDMQHAYITNGKINLTVILNAIDVSIAIKIIIITRNMRKKENYIYSRDHFNKLKINLYLDRVICKLALYCNSTCEVIIGVCACVLNVRIRYSNFYSTQEMIIYFYHQLHRLREIIIFQDERFSSSILSFESTMKTYLLRAVHSAFSN